jgi:hypothetical protein
LLSWEHSLAAFPQSSDKTRAVSQAGSGDRLVHCPKCNLVQRILAEEPATSTSRETVAWPARQLACQVIAYQKLRPTSLVIGIGSRDGRMLTDYQSAGIPVLGIEPAIKQAELARLEHGVPTLCRYFDKYLAAHLAGCGQQADVVHLHHVLPLIGNLDEFTAGLPIVLKDTGVAVIEVPYVRTMTERNELAARHHWQLSYFSLTSLSNLLGGHRMVVHDVERLADGSLRLFVGKQGQTSARVSTMLADEKSWGVDRPKSYLSPRPAKVA